MSTDRFQVRFVGILLLLSASVCGRAVTFASEPASQTIANGWQRLTPANPYTFGNLAFAVDRGNSQTMYLVSRGRDKRSGEPAEDVQFHLNDTSRVYFSNTYGVFTKKLPE